jgi:hypothetical protein
MSTNNNFAMLASEVNFDKLTLSEKVATNNNNSGKTVYASYSDPGYNGIVVETPWMKLPYGVSVWSNEGAGPDRHSLNMSFSSEYSKTTEIDEFKDFIQKLDEYFIAEFQKNSSKWVKKNYTNVDVIRELYTTMYKVSRDKEGNMDKYPATFKLNLPHTNGVYNFPTVDAKNRPITLTKTNTTGAHSKAIIKCVGVWLAAGKFGCTWKLMNLMVIPRDTGNNYRFRALDISCPQIQSDDDDEIDEKPVVTKVIDDDEDEDDEDDDDVDVPYMKKK